MLSERIVYLACRTWNNDLSGLTRVEGVSAEDIRRVCREFDAVSAIWSELAVGESMTLVGVVAQVGLSDAAHAAGDITRIQHFE